MVPVCELKYPPNIRNKEIFVNFDGPVSPKRVIVLCHTSFEPISLKVETYRTRNNEHILGFHSALYKKAGQVGG